MQTGPSVHRPPSDRDPLDAAAWCQWAVCKFVVAVLLHPSTLLIAASSALIHWAVDLDTMSKSSLNIVPEVQRLSTVPMVFLSFIITFRTQACYARWWEGRCLWGALLFACIHLSQQCCGWISDGALKRRVVHMIITFVWASKAQLRDHSIEEADGLQLVERGLLEAAELRTISAQVGWQPYYCLDVIRAVVREAWDSEGGAVFRRESERASALLAIEQTLVEMAKALGGSIRVKATQLPRAYDALTYPFLLVYVWSVAYSYHHDGEVYVWLQMMVIVLVVRAVIAIGDSLAVPFGVDPMALPLARYRHDVAKYRSDAARDGPGF